MLFRRRKQVLIDIDNKSKEDVLEHLMNTVGKSKEVLEAEAVAAEKKDNPANWRVVKGLVCVRIMDKCPVLSCTVTQVYERKV